MLLASLAVVLAGSLCASASAADLVDVRRYAESIQVDVRYATANNFTGAPLDGYCQAQALVLRPRARALARVQRALGRRGLGLKVFDAYRPARASRAMVRWARARATKILLGYEVDAFWPDANLIRRARRLRRPQHPQGLPG